MTLFRLPVSLSIIIFYALKENEENMPKVTGSITLCPPRKGFRSMRKGRTGCGNNSGNFSLADVKTILTLKNKT